MQIAKVRLREAAIIGLTSRMLLAIIGYRCGNGAMVAHLLPKQRVAGSSPVSRSTSSIEGTSRSGSSLLLCSIAHSHVCRLPCLCRSPWRWDTVNPLPVSLTNLPTRTCCKPADQRHRGGARIDRCLDTAQHQPDVGSSRRAITIDGCGALILVGINASGSESRPAGIAKMRVFGYA